MAATKKKAQAKFCSNCGQKVTGAKAIEAANPVMKFCSNCGLPLDDQGMCQNPDCKFFETIPPTA
jgi:predicted amidophosphoribosyltransferase